MTPCSPPSRRGLEALAFAARHERRPSLTAAARGVRGEAGRDEETAFWSNKETDPRVRLGSGCRPSRMERAWAGLRDPGRAALHHGVDVDNQLPGAGDERDLVRLAGCDQSPVERDQRRVPAHRGWQRGGIERASHALATARDVADADLRRSGTISATISTAVAA